MIRYLLQKCVHGALVLLGVIALVFFIFQKAGNDAALQALGQRADKSSYEAIRKEMGLDKPPLVQFAHYVNDLSPIGWHSVNPTNRPYHGFILLQGDEHAIWIKWPYLQRSFQSKKEVATVLSDALAGTFILSVAALLFAILVGIPLGCWAALKKDKKADRLILAFSSIGLSLPSFVAAILVAWTFGYLLADYTGLGMTGNWEEFSFDKGLYFNARNLILPAFTLGIRPLGIIVQLTRSSLLDILQMDFIKTGKAKGLTPYKVMTRHALPNALNPVITAISGWFASLMAGAFFIEYIFNWNGIGKVTVEALEKEDLPVVMGSVLCAAVLFVTMNVLVDLIYGWLDPRVRLTAK